jgi:hypothetical protein
MKQVSFDDVLTAVWEHGLFENILSDSEYVDHRMRAKLSSYGGFKKSLCVAERC